MRLYDQRTNVPPSATCWVSRVTTWAGIDVKGLSQSDRHGAVQRVRPPDEVGGSCRGRRWLLERGDCPEHRRLGQRRHDQHRASSFVVDNPGTVHRPAGTCRVYSPYQHRFRFNGRISCRGAVCSWRRFCRTCRPLDRGQTALHQRRDQRAGELAPCTSAAHHRHAVLRHQRLLSQRGAADRALQAARRQGARPARSSHEGVASRRGQARGPAGSSAADAGPAGRGAADAGSARRSATGASPAPCDGRPDGAKHLLIMYAGSRRAPAHIVRTRDEARALAGQLLVRAQQGRGSRISRPSTATSRLAARAAAISARSARA